MKEGRMVDDETQSLAESLILHTEEIRKAISEKEAAVSMKNETEESRIFPVYRIKDIVFLAVMAACMLVTGAVMPLVGQIPIFGIIQLALALQFSLFPVIGMMKVRKPGALLFTAFCCGALLIFMNTVMFVCMLICAVIAEGAALLNFRSYRKDGACLLAGTVFFPMTLPFLYLYYRFFYSWSGSEGKAVSAFLGSSPSAAIGMSIAVTALCFFGSLIGVLISRELKKSGVMKK